MKIAVLGSAGQLGRDLVPRLPGDVVPLTRADFDLAQPSQIQQVLTALKPDIVVNCAAYNFVDKAETEPEVAFAVNTFAVRSLAQICQTIGAFLVQFSTDYVFGLDASRTTPWSETDHPGPVSVYGLSKLAGEDAIRMTCERHLIIRTCGLYGVWGSGGKGGNFVQTMLRIAAQGKPIRVVGDQRCTPSFTADVADATVALIQAGVIGTVNVTNAGDCSWFEFASHIFATAGVAVEPTAITTKEFGAPAKRPPYSVLALDRLEQLTGKRPRPWRDAVAAYLRERPANRA